MEMANFFEIATGDLMMENEAEVCCEDFLNEIAIESVEGILMDDSDEESGEVEGGCTPDNFASFQEYSISRSNSSFSTPEAPGWGFEPYQIPSRRTMPPSASGEITTVMLRNIPNKYTRAGLLAALSEHGFVAATCNNLYLPMDVESGCNLGYAFLNFVSHGHALEFKDMFDGCRLPSSGSRKVCSVVWANKQGLFQFSASSVPPQQDAYHQLPPMDSTKIFIGGLPVSTTDEDLYNYFGKFGPIRECNIIVNRDSGLSRGFGFVDFVYQESVRIVDEAQQRRPHVVNCRVVSVRFYGAYLQAH